MIAEAVRLCKRSADFGILHAWSSWLACTVVMPAVSVSASMCIIYWYSGTQVLSYKLHSDGAKVCALRGKCQFQDYMSNMFLCGNTTVLQSLARVSDQTVSAGW